MFTLEELKEKLKNIKGNDNVPIWSDVPDMYDEQLKDLKEVEDLGYTLLQYSTGDHDYLVWLKLVNSVFAIDGNAINMQQLVTSTVNTFSEEVLQKFNTLSKEEQIEFVNKIRESTKYNFFINDGILTIVHTTMLPHSDLTTYLQIYPYCMISHTHTVYKYVTDLIMQIGETIIPDKVEENQSE